MKYRQHADIALLDASQAESDKLLLAVHVTQLEPYNECSGGASSVKISRLEVKKHFLWLVKRGVVGSHIACSVPGG